MKLIEFIKNVLVKVSFDRELFRKELKKSIQWLDNTAERILLYQWCTTNFGGQYPDVIQEAFA